MIAFGRGFGTSFSCFPIFSMPFFTDFGVRGYVGLLDWYTVSIAVFASVILAAHGATYLTLKTEGPVHDRSATWTKYLWAASVPLFCRDLGCVVGSGSPRPHRTRCPQSILLARGAHHRCVDNRAGFWNFGSRGDSDR